MFRAPLLAPCSPHLPRPASSLCPSCVFARPAVVFFFLVLCSRSLLVPRALRVPSALLRVTLVPLPCAPSLAPPPLPFSFSQSTLPARLPSLSVHRCHSSVPLVCPTPAPPSRPYPFPWVLPRSPPLTPSWLLGALCGGGGLNWSGVYPPLSSSRACLTTFIAYSFP